MTSIRSPGETLIELLIDVDMINEGAFSAAEYSDQIAALNRAADKLVAPYIARIAELEEAYRNAANARCETRPESIHIRESTGPCEVCAWPDDGLPRRLVDTMRARHGHGGLNVCRGCVARAKRIADTARGM